MASQKVPVAFSDLRHQGVGQLRMAVVRQRRQLIPPADDACRKRILPF